MNPQSATIGPRGTIVLPAGLRRRFGLEQGALVVVEERDGGVLLRPAPALPIETYSPEEQASFLLSNAVDAQDYARAQDNVRAMGLEPDTVPHLRPSVSDDENAGGGGHGTAQAPNA
jgi:AbrB family looped-hinge helix DNA binding protein